MPYTRAVSSLGWPEATLDDMLALAVRHELDAVELRALESTVDLPQLFVQRYGIVGYGPYHYKYATGREGDASIIGLSSRAQYISLYVMGNRGGKSIAEAAKSKLGKASVGKCCITFKKLADLNLPAAMALVREASTLLDNGSTDFSL